MMPLQPDNTPARNGLSMGDVAALALFTVEPSDRIALAGWGSAGLRDAAINARRWARLSAHRRRLAEMAAGAPPAS